MWIGVAVLSFRLLGTTKNISVSSPYRDSVPQIAEVWSVTQLADWLSPVWEEQSKGRGLNVNPHHQLSTVPLSAHTPTEAHTQWAQWAPLVCIGVRFPHWKITRSTDAHKSVWYVVDYRHSIPCRPVERAVERLSVSPLSSHPPDFKTLSALAVTTHASSSTHTHTRMQTRYDTHFWIAWRNRNCWEHNKNPIKRGRERKLSRDWCGEANYHSNIINLLHSEFHYILA